MVACITLSWSFSAPADPASAPVEGTIEALPYEIDESRFDGAAAGAIFEFPISVDSAEFIRLRIDPRTIPGKGTLALQSSDHDTPPLVYDFTKLRQRGIFWSQIVLGSRILVTVTVPTRPMHFDLRISEIFVQRSSYDQFAIIGGDDSTPVNDPRTSQMARSLRDPVARLSFMLKGNFRRCSGFLIDDDRLMTNAHCVPDAATCDTLDAVFGYEADAHGKLLPGEILECESFIDTNQSLDLSIVRIAGQPSERWGAVAGDWRAPKAAEELIIIQHMGESRGRDRRILKRVAEVNCATMPEGVAEENRFAHSCDTETGSSGSPVFDAQGVLVGIHHATICGYEVCNSATDDVEANLAIPANLAATWLTELR